MINVTLPCFIVRMPNFQSNILSSVFYGTVIAEILGIARSSSSVISFYEITSALITPMEKQDKNRGKLIKSRRRMISSSFRSMIYQIEIS